MSQVTVISGVERRRVWTDEQKRALVTAACEPGASVADIARRADLRASQLYRWRRDLAEPATLGFAALTVSPEPEPVAAGAAVVLEIGGAVLRIAADAPPALVSAVVRSLRR
ncbi:MAG TPA: transposase [Sphingomonas sp.]|jgi:transposase